MGLRSNGGDDVADCGNGRKSFGSVSCSICLETVTDNGDQSWANLQCGHQFHLDCIGSSINIKSAMQCRNCRKIEKGRWLYANGCLIWKPIQHIVYLYRRQGEFSSTTYHELLGQHAIFAEHSSSATHPCPYIAYFGPIILPSSSNSSGSVSDSSSHCNGPSVPSEIPTSYAFPAMDLHYHSWEHHSPPFSTSTRRIGSSSQPSIPPVSQRSARNSSDMPRSGSFMNPFVVDDSFGARAATAVASSFIPPYPDSNAWPVVRVQALQAHYHQHHPSTSPALRTPIISGSRRSGSHRSRAEVPVASSSDHMGGFYFIPWSTSASWNFPEPLNPLSTQFHAWESDHLSSFSSNQADRDSGRDAFHVTATSGSDLGIRPSSLRQRHRSERTSSQIRS